MIRPFLVCVMSVLFLVGCESGHTYAPVTEVGMIDAIPKTGTHRVVSGETLYQIAWRYGLDYRYLAARNHITPPYAIHPGQVIYLSGEGPRMAPTLTPVERKTSPPPQDVEETASEQAISPVYNSAKWIWPAKGKVIANFSAQNKGINIAGHQGEPVYAAAAGKVVYCGNGLRGYGNLIILKHNSLYLSAYAHNQSIFVKEGQSVMKGQKIADMGSTGADKTMLHFEIRRAGKPVDPLSMYR